MSEFAHSIVLFSGEDGLPLEFNIQYATDKTSLRALIEYGGGLCTLSPSDDAIYLVSPGTRVLNIDPKKTLISTNYIHDCVKQNYLLETDEYRFQINEMETSDISDNSLNLIGEQDERKSSDDIVNDSVDIIDPNKTVSSNLLTCPNSNHDFDFEDSEMPNNIIADKGVSPVSNDSFVTSPPKTSVKSDACTKEKSSDSSVNSVPDSLEDHQPPVNSGEKIINEVYDVFINNPSSNDSSENVVNARNFPIEAVIVSSSQPNEDNALDNFDNMILKKAHENPAEKDDDCLSQSYTVSSSADAQVSPKVSSHNISAEIFDESPAPDSAGQTAERKQYVNDLEKEIEQILQKPSPKSIQDKITLIKYICIVEKLDPTIVLQTLQNH